ncbi:MAG TPA: HEPN domain-containing protein [Anaerolineales bacterium]|jgi:HEPN domain-containing protein|nr:HEPN domain-containing protein [Anaerolineales bacterium]HQX17196.1 HEPN domain-containing protein [Anaerolineales bacterium]
MSDVDDAREWVKYAEEDLILAKSALRRTKPLTMGSFFHSQQCAEKYLKAILISKDTEFPKTHDLLILDGLCKEAGVLTGFTKDALGQAVGIRRPYALPRKPASPEGSKGSA